MKKPYDPLADSVDVRKLLKSLYFAEEDVATANLHQASLMAIAATYRVQCMRDRIRLEAALDLLRSKWAHRYRRKTTVNGKPLTEPGIKEKTGMNKYVHRAQRELDEAIVAEELSKQVLEVFRQRLSAIQTIVKANSNAIAKELWQLEKQGSSEKLRAAAKAVRGKFKHKESEE